MDKKVLIIGLGLMGGSIAKKLYDEGYEISAYDIDEEALDFAYENCIIDRKISLKEVREFSTVILALYPATELEFMQQNAHIFAPNTIIMDITGVKGPFYQKVKEIAIKNNLRYVSTHPMAGRESIGVTNTDPSMFKGANFIIIDEGDLDPKLKEVASTLGKTLEVGRIEALSPIDHDNLIAYLSQLPHAIAVSLMCHNEIDNLSRFTGDSFRDLTRIAKINDLMWSELFLENKEALLSSIDHFEKELHEIRNQIENDDVEGLREKMRLSTKNRNKF
ncbi:MAG: prephenate dehydrogenase [Bacilli bacterium]|nr:prephenate dehydrogenase [Bacilli bacterium]